MKKLVSLLCCTILLLSLFGCTRTPVAVSHGGTVEKTEEKTERNPQTETEPITGIEKTTEDPEPTEDEPERYRYQDISLILPKGFQITESGGVPLAVPDDYPVHSDNISFTYSPDTTELLSLSKEDLKAMFESAYGTTVASFEMEKDELDGYDVLCLSLNVNLEGTDLFQVQYIFCVDGHATHVTFTVISNSEYLEIFDAVTSTFRIEK